MKFEKRIKKMTTTVFDINLLRWQSKTNQTIVESLFLTPVNSGLSDDSMHLNENNENSRFDLKRKKNNFECKCFKNLFV